MLSLDALSQHQLPSSPPSSSASSTASFTDAGLSPASAHSQTFNNAAVEHRIGSPISRSTSSSAFSSSSSNHSTVPSPPPPTSTSTTGAVIRRPLHYRGPARPRARSFVRPQPISTSAAQADFALQAPNSNVKQHHRTPLQSPLTPPDSGYCVCSAPIEAGVDVCSRGVFCPVSEPDVSIVYPTGLVAHYQQLSAAHLARMACDINTPVAAQAIDIAQQQRRQSIQSLRLDTEGLDLGGALPQLSVASTSTHGRAHTTEGVVVVSRSSSFARASSSSPPTAERSLRSVSSRPRLREVSAADAAAKARNPSLTATILSASASHRVEDSFAAHIRSQCSDTHDIFTSETMLQAAEKQRSRGERPVSRDDESQSQVLGGFASLGRAVSPAPASSHGTPQLGSTEEKRDSTWTTLVPRDHDAHDTLDLLTIEEMGLHSIDVGATSNWDGTRIQSDNEVKPLGWSVARSTLRARKWIVAPTSTPIRTSAIRAARAVVVSDHVTSRRANVLAQAAAEGLPIPSVFTDSTLLELRFLRAGKGAPECTILLGSPAAQRIAERSPMLDTMSLAGSTSRSRSSTANGSDTLRSPPVPVTRSASTGRQRALSRCVSADTLSTPAMVETQPMAMPLPAPVTRALSEHPNRSSLPPGSGEVARLLQSRGTRRGGPSMEASRALPGEADAPFADYVFGLGASYEAASPEVGGVSPRIDQELFDPLSIGPASLPATYDSSPVLTSIDPARIAAYQRAAAASGASSGSRRGGKASDGRGGGASGVETLGAPTTSKKDRRLSDWFRKRRVTNSNSASAGVLPIWDSPHAAPASQGRRFMPGVQHDDNFGRGHTSAPVTLPSRKHKALGIEAEIAAAEPVEMLSSPGATDTFPASAGSAPPTSGTELRQVSSTLEPASDAFAPGGAWSGANRSLYGQRRRSSSDDNIVLSSSLAASNRPSAFSRAAEQAKAERRRHQTIALGQMTAPRRARVAAPPMPQQAEAQAAAAAQADVGSQGAASARSVSHSPFLGATASLASSSLIDDDLDPGALCMWIPLPLWGSSAAPSRYIRVAFIPFAGDASGSPHADSSAFFGSSPAVAAVGVPAWYRKLAHALSPSAPPSSDSPAPASPSLGESHFWTAPRRRTSSVDAFRVTALVVAAPGVDAATLASDTSLPAPGRFPVVLALCDGGRSIDFVTEGWAALGLEHGPALIQGRDEEGKPTRHNEAAVSPLVGVADLIVAGAAAIMDL